jgi:integrase/recombinase XerD
LLRAEGGTRVLKDSSVKRILGTLKNFYNWLFRTGYVKLDPTVGVELPHTIEPGANNLSLQVVEQIFETLETIKFPERNLAMVGLLLHGLRASEVCSLNVSNFRRYTRAADSAAAEADFNQVSEAKSILRARHQ